jgi:ribosomal protein S18 acetylase RimI-like enzyme
LTKRAADHGVRRAEAGDIDVLSRLLIQLYAHELPGMLHGPVTAQIELAHRIVSSAPLGRRYVLERDGEILGMGSLATDDEPRPDIPAGALLPAPLLLGPLSGTRSLLGAARGLLTALDPPAPDEGQIHSVVVDEAARGQGLGAVILAHLEDDALALGRRQAVLQVISSNGAARSFYRAAGYAETEYRPGPIRRALAYPSVIMRRELPGG